jgi:TRAP-type transport system periplasmic protein
MVAAPIAQGSCTVLVELGYRRNYRMSINVVSARVIRRLITILFSLTLSLAYAPIAQAQMVLRLAHYAETNHPAQLAALQFAKNVEARTKGQIKIEIFPASQLGSPPEQLEKVQLGAVDMALPAHVQLDKFDKSFGAVLLPFVFDDLAHAHRVFDGPVMAWLAPLAEKQGFVLLANWEWGFRNLTNSKQPINTPDDVKGLKIRVPPEMQLEATIEAMGGKAIKIAFPELYMALSQKVIDGEENPISVIISNKLYEVQRHLALTAHAYKSMVHVINAKRWASLTLEQQRIIREESKAAGEMMRQTMVSQEKAQMGELQAAGVQITRPDPTLFRARMEPAYKKISAYAGETNVQKFLKMVNDERKNSP